MTAGPSLAHTASAPWLSDDEQATWRAFLAMQRKIRDRLERQLQQDAGVPMTYYIILAMLSEAPERTLRMTELATIAGTSQSQLSHAASRLEEAGWIERRRCLDDKRGYLAVLTDAGFEVLTRPRPATSRACGRCCSTRSPRSRCASCAPSRRRRRPQQ